MTTTETKELQVTLTGEEHELRSRTLARLINERALLAHETNGVAGAELRELAMRLGRDTILARRRADKAAGKRRTSLFDEPAAAAGS